MSGFDVAGCDQNQYDMKEWKDRPPKAEVLSYWYKVWNRYWEIWQSTPDNSFVKNFCIDIGEPNCWGCGRSLTEYDTTDSKEPLHETIRKWNRIRELQVCHIVPRSMGGKNTPRNCVLMCSWCHREAPNTKDRKAFIKWMNYRKEFFMRKMMGIVIDAFDSLKAPKEDGLMIILIGREYLQREFDQFFEKNTSQHWGHDRWELEREVVMSKIGFYFQNVEIVRNHYKEMRNEARKELGLPALS